MNATGYFTHMSSFPFGSSSRVPSRVDTLDEWLAALLQPTSLTELAALIGCGLLAERSVRIGDNIRIDNFEGRITDINARYTVVRALSGRESIVPNEMFISNRIENLSLSDLQVLQTTLVSVGYDSDVELVMRLLSDAALAQDRVVREPVPSAHLTNFGADGLEFTLNYWMTDPENGQQNLRSRVNLDILKALRANGVEIPLPQRVVHAGLLGSDANFITMQSIAPEGRAKGTMNLDSDPKNPASTAQRRNSPEK